MAITFGPVIPVLRIFDEAKAREFYLDFLDCKIDWEHRFAPDLPLYMQLSRAGLVLHLSEHHGDGSPGAHVFVEATDVDALHAELNGRNYRFNRPGIEERPWNARTLTVIDPFGNQIMFNETCRTETAVGQSPQTSGRKP